MQQPPNNQPPPFGNQPSGDQPQFGDQPTQYVDQPPASQPPSYGNQPSYGSQPPQYGSQPPQYGGQPPQYGGQPPQYGSQPPYGNQHPPYGQSLDVQPQEENDKIIAAASYVLWILLGVIILVTDMKNKPFLRFHAYQSITFGLVLFGAWIVTSMLSFVIIGFCLMPFLLLAPFYPAYLAYTKGTFRLPLVTDLTYNLFKETPRIP
jgi:uncharacterized membrane protein